MKDKSNNTRSREAAVTAPDARFCFNLLIPLGFLLFNDCSNVIA